MKKALVVAMVMVLGLGVLAFAGPMSGSFSVDICLGIAPCVEGVQTDSTVSLSSFDSTLEVDYSVCGWEFASVSTFGLCGWETQDFSVDGVMGAFTFDSSVAFNPTEAAFIDWLTGIGVSIAGINLDVDFLLTNVGAGWAFGIGSGVGACSLGADIYFNSLLDPDGNLVLQTDSYCFCFSSVEFYASFPFCCIELVDVTIGFSNEGFGGVTFSVDGVPVPGMEWLTYDLALTFQEGDNGKTLSVTPGVDFGGAEACIDFGLEVLTVGTAITGINVYSVGLECDMGQGVTFSSLSYLDFPKHYFNPGGVPIEAVCCGWYWEKFSISSSSDACCGGGFEFDLDVYFGADSWSVKEGCCSEPPVPYECIPGHPWLFDVARVDASFSIGLGSNFSLTGGLALQDYVWNGTECVEGGLTGICVGFEVTF